jgi:hypothetical protein
VISNINVSATLNGTATITWTTDELSDSRVDYGTSPALLDLNSSIPTLTTSHSVTLSGLTADVLYYFRVSSKDATGNNAVSPPAANAPLQFKMPKPPTTTVCASDDLAGEFSMGNTGNNSAVVNNDDGERGFEPKLYSRTVLP